MTFKERDIEIMETMAHRAMTPKTIPKKIMSSIVLSKVCAAPFVA